MREKMSKILNIGSLNVDMVYTVDHFVKPGETIAANSVTIHPGGKGLNQSVALSRVGAKVWQGGKIGKDSRFLVDVLNESGVNTDFVKVGNELTGTAIIQLDKIGQNSIILNHGANFQLTKQDGEEFISHFEKNDFLILQNEVSCLEELIKLGHEKKMRIVLNPSPIDNTILNLPLENISYLILNEIEGEALTGEKKPHVMLSCLLKKSPNLKIVLTLGASGAIFKDKENQHSLGSCSVDVIDTTAAGDTFLGFFIGSIAKGETEERSLILATKASALVVGKKGAAQSIPTIDEVNATCLVPKVFIQSL